MTGFNILSPLFPKSDKKLTPQVESSENFLKKPSMTRKKLLLLGAGPTSSLIAFNIKNSPQLQDAFDIHVWEKSRGIGGRFSTTRSPNNPKSYGDLGAQYLTWSGGLSSKPYFETLKNHKLIKEFQMKDIPGFRYDSSKINYVCSQGTSSVVKHFFEQAGCGNGNMSFNKLVKEVTPNNGDKKGCHVHVDGDGDRASFDIVISTIPVPQLLQFHNISGILQQDAVSDLRQIRYTSRYALGLFYDTKSGPFNTNPPSALNFVKDDSTFKYWSVENLKRGNEEDCAAIVFHTSVEFGVQHVESTPNAMKDYLLEKARPLINSGDIGEPSFVKSHKWRYSQVDTAYPNEPGFVEIAENFIATGDGFTRSGFEGCVEASQKTTEYLSTLL